jgi:hypothetical protein
MVQSQTNDDNAPHRLVQYGLVLAVIAGSVLSVDASLFYGEGVSRPPTEFQTARRPHAFEPGALALFGAGVFGLVGMARRRSLRRLHCKTSRWGRRSSAPPKQPPTEQFEGWSARWAA